jgi:hypothetical protein
MMPMVSFRTCKLSCLKMFAEEYSETELRYGRRFNAYRFNLALISLGNASLLIRIAMVFNRT